MRIIPAVDIIGGKCVRLTKGDYNTKKIYNENPVEVAKLFEDEGMKYRKGGHEITSESHITKVEISKRKFCFRLIVRLV